jgi:hypothetical protein
MSVTKRFNLNRRWGALCVVASLALGTVSWTWALEEVKSSQPQGLRGILPADVPVDLGEDAFAVLDGNWREWSQTAAAEVSKLYADESLSPTGQREQLGVLKKKLSTMSTSLKDSRYSSIHVALGSLYAALNRRVALAEAVLDTLELDPQKAASDRLEAARQGVAKALSDLEKELQKVKNGPAWLSYVRSAEIARLVSDKQGAEAASIMAAVHQKLSPTDTMSDDVREFLSGAKFVALRESLDQFVKVTTAVNEAYSAEKLRAELTKLVAAVERFEETRSSDDAAAVRKAFDSVRKASPDNGERIAAAMATHYFNYNLRVVVSEAFLSKLVAKTETSQGPVRDFILGANVTGQQTTTATVGVDLKPNPQGISLHLTLDGVSRSNTAGVTDEATVYTSGNHTFHAWKPVTFDGKSFIVGTGDIVVYPHNTTTGIATQYSDVPLFGGIADSIARGEVAKKRPQSEAIAAQRVSSRVLPEFSSKVDAEIAKLNQDLENKVNAKLREKDLFPSATSYRSSESDLRVLQRLMGDHELAGGDGPFVSVPNQGFVVALHESLLNNSLDRLKFAGRTITDKELASEIEKSFSDLLGRDLKATKKIEEAGEGSKEPATFIFPEKDPIRLRVNNGQLLLVIRAGLKQKPGEEDIPTQEITVPLVFRIEGSKLVIESEQVGVSPVDPPANAGLQIARAQVVRAKVQNALPTRAFDRFISIDKNRQTPIQLGLSQIKLAGGWLSLSFE